MCNVVLGQGSVVCSVVWRRGGSIVCKVVLGGGSVVCSVA